MTRAERTKSDMVAAGVYSVEDIEEICRLESEYEEECEEIAIQCADEGYPSHGANYELRCENARRYYDEQIDIVASKYEKTEDRGREDAG